MQNVDWDIFRFIIAVADNGSAFAAAEKLGVNASTVLRRITKFEEMHGLRLFDRHQSGYSPTPQCHAVLETARLMEQNVSDISRDILGSDVRLEGNVSFTTTETFLDTVMAPLLAEFTQLHPNIHLEVTVTNSRLNLTRHDADVALRPSLKPPETLIGQRISEFGFAVYASTEFVKARDLQRDNINWDNHPWIGVGDSLANSPVGKWMAANVDPESVVMSADSFPTIRLCAASGGGLAVLPCCLGDDYGGLERVSSVIEDMTTVLWLLTHRGYRNAARVRAFIDFIAPALRRARPVFEGRGKISE